METLGIPWCADLQSEGDNAMTITEKLATPARRWDETRFAKQSVERAAWLLFLAGYQSTSNRFGIASRVDVRDVGEFFELHYLGQMDHLTLEQQEDFYRRVHTNDRIEDIPRSVMNELRRLTHKGETVGYLMHLISEAREGGSTQ